MGNVEKQYKDSSNLETRINIHQLYSVNKKDWHAWVFEHYDIPPNSRILEIGCGDGTFWLKNKDRIPDSWNITLSDLSSGMLDAAKGKLREIDSFDYLQLNIEGISLEDESVDVVIANHMLYHVPNRDTAFQEVRRVLKPDGLFYASTIGKNHMKEFGELAREFDSGMIFNSATVHAEEFGIENGEVQLRPYFKEIKFMNFPGNLAITDERAVADYILSSNTEAAIHLVNERLAEFLQYLKKKKEDNHGVIEITKSTGLFVSRK